MLVVFPPIFVADTKIIYGYSLVAPLKKMRIGLKWVNLKIKLYL